MSSKEKIELIMRHIKHVEDNCYTLALKIVDKDEDFALKLIQRGRMHDLSKFGAYEFEHLWSVDGKFREALIRHRAVNPHHPEYYPGGVFFMEDLDIAEMVCDCAARSAEFGTSIRDWFSQSIYDSARERIDYYLNLLLHQKFVYPDMD